MTALQELREATITRRIGRWAYSADEGLNPGWRLDGTGLVLDYDPLDAQGERRGRWQLWRDGAPGESIDHYLDASMAYVEAQEAAEARQ